MIGAWQLNRQGDGCKSGPNASLCRVGEGRGAGLGTSGMWTS